MGSTGPVVVAQRSQALSQANRIRSARATLKRALESGRRSAAEVISDPPWIAQTMPVRQVVVSQRGWGTVRSRRLLRSASVPEDKALGSLTERQRRALLAMLPADDDRRARVHELSAL
jgi:hypothetical protein